MTLRGSVNRPSVGSFGKPANKPLPSLADLAYSTMCWNATATAVMASATVTTAAVTPIPMPWRMLPVAGLGFSTTVFGGLTINSAIDYGQCVEREMLADDGISR